VRKCFSASVVFWEQRDRDVTCLQFLSLHAAGGKERPDKGDLPHFCARSCRKWDRDTLSLGGKSYNCLP